MQTRRDFVIGGLSALGAACVRSSGGDPVLTVGVLSDPHVSLQHPERTDLLKRAFRLVADKGADVVAVVGDMTDTGLVVELEQFADAWRSLNLHSRLFAVLGNRDMSVSGKISQAERLRMADRAIYPDPAAVWKRVFGEAYDADFLHCEYRGIRFFGAHWGKERVSAEAFVHGAGRGLDPDVPFLYFQHAPPYGTSFKVMWEPHHWDPISEMLSRYPNAIVFSGHTHHSIADDTVFWHRGFVSIGAGSTCDAKTCPFCEFVKPQSRSQAAILRLYDSKAVYERYDVLAGSRMGRSFVWDLPTGDGLPSEAYPFA